LAQCTEDQVSHKVALLNLLIDEGANTRYTSDEGSKMSVVDVVFRTGHRDARYDERQIAIGETIAVLFHRDPSLLENCVLLQDRTLKDHVIGSSECPPGVLKAIAEAAPQLLRQHRPDTLWSPLLDFSYRYPEPWRALREKLNILLSVGIDVTRANAGETVLMKAISASTQESDHVCILIGDIAEHILGCPIQEEEVSRKRARYE
jgi:hypothetical protein